MKDLGIRKIWVDYSGTVKEVEVDLSGVKGNPVSIVNVTFNAHGSLDLDKGRGYPGYKIFICSDSKTYPRDSLENVVLSTAFSLKKSREIFFKTKYSKKTNLTPLNVWIHPSVYQNNSQLLDNAFALGTKDIAILEHSSLGLKLMMKGTNLWEELSVVSHEYGHILLNHIYPLTSSSTKTTYDLHNAIGERTTIRAYHEAFADLFLFTPLT